MLGVYRSLGAIAGLAIGALALAELAAAQQIFTPPPRNRPSAGQPVPPPAAPPQSAPPAVAPVAVKTDAVMMQGLDKVVARVRSIEAPIGKPVMFGTLTVVARACAKSIPEAPPETAAFIEVTETKPGGEPKRIFAGWMLASSPALSALEHPVYDVWVVACKTTSSAPPPGPAPAPSSR